MKELVLPVPKMVSATYGVPVPTPMGTAEARQKASTTVETRLTGPLRTLTAEWLANGVVKVGVEAAGPPPSGLLDRELFGTPEQRVLLARARAVMRRRSGRSTPDMACGALTVDPVRREVTFRGAPVELSAREFAVLEALMKEPGAVVSREKLEDAVYGWGEEVGSNSIEVHLHHLRRKLEPDPHS